MRAKGPARVLIVLLAVSLLPATAVLATHGPQAKYVVTEATGDPWFMSCTPVSGQQTCTMPSERVINHRANVLPDDGPLQSIFTRVNGTINGGYYMFAVDQQWNAALHGVGCNNPSGMGAYFAELGKDSPGPKTVGPTVIGECSITGTLTVPTDQAPYYEVTSTTLQSAFPTPTPSPTPVLTATPKPTVTARPTPTARPTATVAATAAASESGSASASASESASASQSEGAAASETPEQSVAGGTGSPEPSVPAQAPQEGLGGWPGSVPGTGEVSGRPGDVAGSAIGALLLLVIMGFIGELFNNTMETNYARMIDWWKKSWLGRIGRGMAAVFGGGSR